MCVDNSTPAPAEVPDAAHRAFPRKARVAVTEGAPNRLVGPQARQILDPAYSDIQVTARMNEAVNVHGGQEVPGDAAVRAQVLQALT
jgi:hypothetical protein